MRPVDLSLFPSALKSISIFSTLFLALGLNSHKLRARHLDVFSYTVPINHECDNWLGNQILNLVIFMGIEEPLLQLHLSDLHVIV